MALLDFFKQKRNTGSASLAKERLQILVAHDRAGPGPSYLPQLQRDLLQVIRKYVAVDTDAISVQVEHEGNQEILELNIVLPEA
jgi:cell division topological specificity factor